MYFFYYIFLAFPFFIPFALADEGVPINLRKYSRVAKGERLRLVKERLTAGISHSSQKEKSVDDELPDEGEEKPTKPDVSKKKPRVIKQEQDEDDLI